MSTLAQTQALQSMAGQPQVDDQQGGGVAQTGGDAGFVGGGGPLGGPTQAAAPAGAGPRWTNIQAYLKANQGDTGAASSLKQRAESVFGQERSQAESSSAQAKSQAQDEVQNLVGQDRASQLLESASQNYNFDPQNVNQFQNSPGIQHNANIDTRYQNYGGTYSQNVGGRSTPWQTNQDIRYTSEVPNFYWQPNTSDYDYHYLQNGFDSAAIDRGANIPGGKLSPPSAQRRGGWSNPYMDPYTQGGDQALYSQNVSDIKNAMTRQYGGPTDWAYGLGQQAQELGGLGDQSTFKQYMGDLYDQRAGRQLSSGQQQLQDLLDVSNPALVQARQNILADLGGLQGDIDTMAQDTQGALTQAQEDYSTKQTGLLNYLNSYDDTLASQIAQDQGQALDAYNQAYTTDRSGMKDANTALSAGGYSVVVPNIGNMTWEQMKQNWDATAGLRAAPLGQDSGRFVDYFKEQGANMTDFLNQQRAQHWLTGADDARRYNTLMDILGSDERKSLGYDVRPGGI